MMPLIMLQRGEQAQIRMVRGGLHVQNRLESMGFVPGAEIEMVTNPVDGPVIVSIKGARVAVGRGMLHHIWVTNVNESADVMEPASLHGHPHRLHRHHQSFMKRSRRIME